MSVSSSTSSTSFSSISSLSSSSTKTEMCSHSNTTTSTTAELIHDFSKMQFQTKSKESKDEAKSTVESVVTPVKSDTPPPKTVKEIKIPKGAFLSPNRCLQMTSKTCLSYDHFKFHNHIYALNEMEQSSGTFLSGAIEVSIPQEAFPIITSYPPYEKLIESTECVNYAKQVERDFLSGMQKMLHASTIIDPHLKEGYVTYQQVVNMSPIVIKQSSVSSNYFKNLNSTTLLSSKEEAQRPSYTGQWRMRVTSKEVNEVNMFDFHELILESWEKGQSGVYAYIQVVDTRDNVELVGFRTNPASSKESLEKRVAFAKEAHEELKQDVDRALKKKEIEKYLTKEV